MKRLVVTAATVAVALTLPVAAPPAVAAPPERVFAFLSRADGRELTRLAQFGRRISVLAPNWYEIDVDSAAMRRPWDRRPVLAAAARARVPVWPVINARTAGSPALDDPLMRERIARAVVRVAAERGHAGITLDIEELAPTQRDAYTALVARVRALLPRGKRLAVYVPRPTAGGSALAYDWPALTRVVDLLLVATYNETGPGGPPGPVDTSAGFGSVLGRAAAVSRQKVAPIVGAFGYAWPRAGGRGELISTIDAERRRTRCGVARVVTDGSAAYDCGAETVHHQTLAGLRARSQAVGAAGFRWVALFSLGREPRGFWNGIRAVRR